MAKRREGPWFARRTPNDPNSKFYAYWYDSDARQRRGLSLDTKDPEEARARFGAFLIQGASLMETPSERAAQVTVDAVLNAYMRDHVEPNVIDKAGCRYFEAQLLSYFGGIAVADIGVPECRGYDAFQRKRGLGDGAIRRQISHLQAAVNHAKKWRLLPTGVDPVFEKPKPSEPKGQWFFLDELERLRAAASEEVRDFIDITYFTAARRATVVDLTLRQIDREAARIKLNPAGRKVTRKRRPVVPIDPAMVPALTRRCEIALADPDAALFPGTPKVWYDRFVGAAEAAGLRELEERGTRPAGNCGVHTLRHSRATHLLQKGVSPWAVSSLLGDTLSTVVRTYGHHCPDHLQEILSAPDSTPASAV